MVIIHLFLEKCLGSTYAEEKAILKCIENFGYVIKKTTNEKTILTVNGEQKTYHIVGQNRYSNERKRMSLIVKKHPSDQESILYCKASDISVLKLLTKENEEEQKLIISQITKLANLGYRFFVLCRKFLNEDETTSFITKYKSAENYVLQRELHFERVLCYITISWLMKWNTEWNFLELFS